MSSSASVNTIAEVDPSETSSIAFCSVLITLRFLSWTSATELSTIFSDSSSSCAKGLRKCFVAFGVYSVAGSPAVNSLAADCSTLSSVKSSTLSKSSVSSTLSYSNASFFTFFPTGLAEALCIGKFPLALRSLASFETLGCAVGWSPISNFSSTYRCFFNPNINLILFSLIF